MNWKPRLYKQGETRIRTRFLWFPKCINKEWRWLEMATWEEEFHIDRSLFGDMGNRFELVTWVSPEPEKKEKDDGEVSNH